MSSPTDQIGNPLMKGDMVIITDGDRYLYGVISDIKESGLVLPNAPGPVPLDFNKGRQRAPEGMEMAGLVQIQLMPMKIPFGSKVPMLPNVTKVVKPPQLVAAEQRPH